MKLCDYWLVLGLNVSLSEWKQMKLKKYHWFEGEPGSPISLADVVRVRRDKKLGNLIWVTRDTPLSSPLFISSCVSNGTSWSHGELSSNIRQNTFIFLCFTCQVKRSNYFKPVYLYVGVGQFKLFHGFIKEKRKEHCSTMFLLLSFPNYVWRWL